MIPFFLLFMLLSSTAFAERGVIIYFDGSLMLIETDSSGYSCGWEYWFPYAPIGQDGREGDDVEGDNIEGNLTVCSQQRYSMKTRNPFMIYTLMKPI